MTKPIKELSEVCHIALYKFVLAHFCVHVDVNHVENCFRVLYGDVHMSEMMQTLKNQKVKHSKNQSQTEGRRLIYSTKLLTYKGLNVHGVQQSYVNSTAPD